MRRLQRSKNAETDFKYTARPHKKEEENDKKKDYTCGGDYDHCSCGGRGRSMAVL